MDKTTKNILLVLLLVLVLTGGGFAVFKVFKEPNKTGKKGDNATGDAPKPIASGLDDPLNTFTDDELRQNTLSHDGFKPDYEAALMDSTEGKRLIAEEMQLIQIDPRGDSWTQVRGQAKAGESLFNNPKFSPEANKAIKKMFGYLPKPVDPNNPSTWPIYGKYQAEGQQVRKELEEFLSIPERDLHLGPGGKHSGWIPSLGLNIMMLTNVTRLPSLLTIRGNWATGGDREGLINYKHINNIFGTHERYLSKMVRGRSPYLAKGNRELAKSILNEMDNLDAWCREKAIQKLVGNKMLIRTTTKGGAMPADEQKKRAVSTRINTSKT